MPNNLHYQNDLHGYDQLYTFISVFQGYSDWAERLTPYMIFNKLEDFEYSEQLFNMTFNVYKNYYFRYRNLSEVYNEIASRIEVLITSIKEGEYILENAKSLSGEQTTTTNYKTNNSSEDGDEENEEKYRTHIETVFIDNGENEVRILEAQAKNRDKINAFIKDLRTMFMAQIDENAVNEIYNKGGQ